MKGVSASQDSRRQEGAERVIYPPATSARFTPRPGSGVGVVLGVFAALLILFLWLHLIVAQDNESIGREIQARTEELARIERENMALRQKVAATWAEEVMAERALTLGYRPQQPLYLLVNRPLIPTAAGSRVDALLDPSIFRRTLTDDGGVNPAPEPASKRTTGTVEGRP